MATKLEKTLESFGLNLKESAVYLASLELGSAVVQKIARQNGLPRPTVYGILEDLAAKGLVSSFEKRGVKHYTAEDPEKLIELAKEKVRALEQALPQLRALYKTVETRPLVRFFQGKDGMKAVLEEVLKDRQNFMAISSADDLFTVLEDYFPKFVERRVKLKIANRVILRDSPKARERKALGQKELRQVRLIAPSYEFHGMKMIFGRKVAFFTFNQALVTVVVESAEVARLEQAEFELLWQSLPA